MTLADLREDPPLQDAETLTRRALLNPSRSAPLAQRINPSDKVAVLVEDSTRASPKGVILKLVLRELERAGVASQQVSVVIALGTHRPLSRKELEAAFGADIVHRYHVVNHDCRADDLVPVARLSTGTTVRLNPFVNDATFRIGLGSVFPHPLNGFGGGGKILFPGVADSGSILAHHLKHSLAEGTRLGRLEGNPFYEEITGIAKSVGLDFIVNSVLDHRDRLREVVAGDPMEAHRLGVQQSRRLLSVPFQKKSDVTVISSFPYSDGLQIMKSLAVATSVTRKGGIIALFADGTVGVPAAYAEACEAIRHEHGGGLESWVNDCFSANRTLFPGAPPEINMSLARALRTQERCKVILVNNRIPKTQVRKLGFQRARDLREAFESVQAAFSSPDVNVIPSGGMIIPLLNSFSP